MRCKGNFVGSGMNEIRERSIPFLWIRLTTSFPAQDLTLVFHTDTVMKLHRGVAGGCKPYEAEEQPLTRFAN